MVKLILKLLRVFDSIGSQLFYLRSIFLNFHRANSKKILEFLRNQWAIDRKAEWSIWMVYTKVEMPHQYISSVANESSYHGLPGTSSRFNEEKTSGDFREMGQRLAQEVVSFVKKKMDKVSRSGVLRTIKLSFVGHSIGNIIY
ncbi:hypothetical protein F511_22698 [Dorcoceras hygrometricum]|uniref:DUF676 domain-containing protein n=1 Tax=Dorcoceras hygrometricum TaxID=472368 RepID=A0A2Z7BYF5_9LAMI|nr:hypothetical protein F511_22698 [Dorcoceras hygrometricum]